MDDERFDEDVWWTEAVSAATGRPDLLAIDAGGAGLAAAADVAALKAALGRVEDGGHEWDDDPAGWVRQQRTGG